MAHAFFDLLKDEHETVSGIFDDLADTTDRAEKTRQKGFAKLKAALVPHMRGEEEAFYSVLMDDAPDLSMEAVEEHHVVDLLLAELSEMDVTEENWGAKVTVLQELVDHHVEEEEGDIFDAAQENLDSEQLDQIMEEFQAITADLEADS